MPWVLVPLLLLSWWLAVAPAGAATPVPDRQDLHRLLGDADAMLAALGRLRGLAVPAALKKNLRSRDAIVRRYLELLRERYPGARLEAERKVLVKLALIPPDFPLEKFLGDMAAEQVAAYYDHLRAEIVLADWLPAPVQGPVLAHELVHALQDRHLNLRKFLERRPGRSDFLLARHAMLEGEATALMLDFVAQAMGPEPPPLPDPEALAATGAGSPILSAAPKFLRDQLLFPYVGGAGFVATFRKQHPWPAFTQVYRNPPRSTEQILHPEKYLGQQDPPQLVLLPDLGGLLGPGWGLVLEDDAGEQGVRGILERFLPRVEAQAAAAGWGGDQYHLYERAADGHQALVFLTAWDTEADAREFAEAYTRLVPLKYAGARPQAGSAAGRREAANRGSRQTWRREGEVLMVERRGGDVLVIEGVPRARIDRVRHWVWRLRAAQR